MRDKRRNSDVPESEAWTDQWASLPLGIVAD